MRKKFYLVMLSIISALLIVGCKNNMSDDMVVLKFVSNAGYVAEFEERMDEFHELYPNIVVEVEGIAASSWGEMLNTIAMDIYAGESPDIADIASEGMHTFAESGLLEPLDTYIERDMAEISDSLEEIPDILRYAHVINGVTYSLPTVWNNMAIYYNKNVLTAAGLSEPEPGWTIEDFHSMAQTVVQNNTGGSDDVYGYAFFQNLFTTIEPWLQAFNTSILNDDWTASTINNEHAKDAYKLLYDMVYDTQVSPSMGTDDFSLFIQDKLAFMGSGMWYVEKLRNNGFSSDDYDVVPFPSVDGQIHSVIGVGGMPIFKDSEHKEEAWKLAKFLSSKDFQEDFLSTNIWAIPSIESAALSVFSKNFFPNHSNVFWDATTYGKNIPAPASYTAIESAVLRGFGAYMAQIKAISAVLQETQDDINEALND